jgi:hypothetical protein
METIYEVKVYYGSGRKAIGVTTFKEAKYLVDKGLAVWKEVGESIIIQNIWGMVLLRDFIWTKP